MRLLGMTAEERSKAILLFTYFFIIIATYWVQKPIRTSKFLVAIGPEFLPFVKLGTAFLIVPFVLLYSSMVRRYCRECMIAGLVSIFILCSIAFWYLFSSNTGEWVNWVFFFYVDIYNTIMVALFWSFANGLTPPQQARRIYGFVGAGGILGGVMGSAFIGLTVESLGPANLLLVSAALLSIIPLAWSLMRVCSLPMPTILAENSAFSWGAAFAGARITFSRPYLLSIAVIIGCYEIVSNIVDYQFSFAAVRTFPQEGVLASFLGKLSSVIISVSVVFQVVFTTWILRQYGPKVGLLLLPIVLGLGSLFFLIFPFFAIATVMFASDGSLHYSINQTSKETLYTPLDEMTIYQAKAFIDMFLFRFSKGISALIILGSNLWLIPLGFKIHQFGLLSVVFISIWMVVAYYAGDRFFKAVQDRRAQPI